VITVFYKTKEQLQNYAEPLSLDKEVKTVKEALARMIEQHGLDVVHQFKEQSLSIIAIHKNIHYTRA
jgi:hypothetical protein